MQGVDDRVIAQNAARLGISAMPLSGCYLRRPARGGLILGYGATDKKQVQEGVRKLAICLRGMKT